MSVEAPEAPAPPDTDEGGFASLYDFLDRSLPERSLLRNLGYAWQHRLTVPGRGLVTVGVTVSYAAFQFGYAYPIYMLALILIGLLGVHLVVGQLAMPRVEVERALPRRVAAGAVVPLRAKVTNPSRRPLYDFTLRELSNPRGVEFEPQPELTPVLPGRSEAIVHYRVRPTRRGVYGFPGPRVLSAFPFGLYYAQRRVSAPGQILVTPRFHPLEALELPAGRKHQPGGLELVSQVGDSEEFIGNREYRPGDRLRDLDQRAWARVGRPIVREFQQEYLTRIALVVDTHAPKARRDDLEAGISLCAAVADALSRLEYVVDLFAAGPELYRLQAGRSLGYLEDILDVLACLQAVEQSPFETLGPQILDEVQELSTCVLVLLDWDEGARASPTPSRAGRRGQAARRARRPADAGPAGPPRLQRTTAGADPERGHPGGAQPVSEPRADWIAYGMVAAVLLALTRAAGGQLALELPLYALLLGLVATRGRWRLNLGWISVSLLLAPLLLLVNLVDVKGRGGNQFLRSFYLGYAMVELALLQLYARPSPAARGRVIYLTAAGFLFVAVGLPDYISTLPGWRESGPFVALGRSALHPHLFYAACAGAWLLLALTALRPRRPDPGTPGARGRRVAWALCAVVVCAGAGGGIYGFRAYYSELSEAYYRLVGNTALGGGFSDRGDLGSVLDLQGEAGGRRIAVRAVGDVAPGYLRGRSFLTYAEGSWAPGAESILPLPESGRLRRPQTDAERVEAPSLWIYPTGEQAAVIFAPLTAGELRLPGEAARLLPGWCLRPYQGDVAGGYAVSQARAPWHFEAERPEYRALPEDPELVAELEATWARILDASPDAGSSHDTRVAALRAYFDRRYTYRFGIAFEGPSDPVTQFLRDKEHGHCELFASAGTLLLRQAGIPARYTTGFLCLEGSPVRDRLWIARTRAAHAWIEAYHPERGWEVVEFTPTDGLPATDPASGGTALLEALGGWFSELWGALRGRASELPGRLLAALRELTAWFTASPLRWGGLLALLGLAIAWRLWRRRGPRAPRAREAAARELPPALAALRARFLELEAALRRAGVPRAPGETALELRARLAAGEWPLPETPREEALEFLARFAVERYRPPEAP
ncbi:MAG: transglutaminase domain-containing protein [Planctomycetota bacterium]